MESYSAVCPFGSLFASSKTLLLICWRSSKPSDSRCGLSLNVTIATEALDGTESTAKTAVRREMPHPLVCGDGLMLPLVSTIMMMRRGPEFSDRETTRARLPSTLTSRSSARISRWTVRSCATEFRKTIGCKHFPVKAGGQARSKSETRSRLPPTRIRIGGL